jgi:hypothetical protein
LTDRKPTARFWITAALAAVLVGYPLSLGPACWLVGRGFIPSSCASVFYRPVLNNGSGPWLIQHTTMNNLDSMIGLLLMRLEPNSKEVSRVGFP